LIITELDVVSIPPPPPTLNISRYALRGCKGSTGD